MAATRLAGALALRAVTLAARASKSVMLSRGFMAIAFCVALVTLPRAFTLLQKAAEPAELLLLLDPHAVNRRTEQPTTATSFFTGLSMTDDESSTASIC